MKDKEFLSKRFGENLQVWKKQFAPRRLNVIVVEDKCAVLRPVTAKEVSEFSILATSGDGLEKASRYLLDILWLDGDPEIRDDEEYFISAMMQLQNTIELKKSDFFRL